MEEINDSDILKTQMDLVNISEIDVSARPSQDIDESLQPSTSSVRGFCVKEYEEEMQTLKKENFNLKLRIYFLEEKNPNVPEGAEAIYKQNIDLKVENENLIKEVQEKQDLLCQASKALELLDEEKHHDQQHHQMLLDELNQKIEAYQHEVNSLQNALVDANKSNLGNDTGFTDFLGAVDSKDIDHQRKLIELSEMEAKFSSEKVGMEKKIKELQNQKNEIETKVSNLLYENDEIRDKLESVEKQLHEEISQLEADLSQFKDKWASTQCDLQDTEEKLKETERERSKTLSLLKETLDQLHEEKNRIEVLERQIANISGSGMNKERTSNNSANLVIQKNSEIEKLRKELEEAKNYIQDMTSQELKEKDLEIKKLQNLLRNLEVERVSLAPNTRFSLEQLSESFNELKFQQAMEEKKNSQKKIDQLMGQLVEVANTTTRIHVNQLQEQMKIVVEKQEITDNALGKCADLCGITLDHLHELARFLASLLKQKEIRESLDQISLINIQSAIDRTLEFSQNAGRFSTACGNLSLLPDISSLDLLMTSARQSLANVKEVSFTDKSIQSDCSEQLKDLHKELRSAKSEAEDLDRVNQILEDEILKLKAKLEEYQDTMMENDNIIVDLKFMKDSLNSKLQESQAKIQILNGAHYELEQKLQEETIKKFDCEKRLDLSESIIAELEGKLDAIRVDLESNWIPKSEHDAAVTKLEDDIVNGEAQVAAIRMEMDLIVSNLNQMKMDKDEIVHAAAADVDDNKENLGIQTSEEQKSLEDGTFSPSRPESPMNEAGVVAVNQSNCPMCPKYRVKVNELKKYLGIAMEKIKKSSEKEKIQTQNIQKQLSSTENFLHSARTNMEKILKTRNPSQQEN